MSGLYLITESHVHSTIKHDVLASHGHEDATASNISRWEYDVRT